MKQSQDRVGQAAGRLRFGRAPIATIVTVEVKDQMKSEAGGDVCSSSDSYEEGCHHNSSRLKSGTAQQKNENLHEI